MGVDLTLLPIGCDAGTWGYAHTMLEVGRHYETHKLLEEMVPKSRPEWKLSSFCARVPDGSMEGERCYGVVAETPYGEPITYLSSAEVVDAMEAVDELWEHEAAALAYLKALPLCQVALYWH